MEEPYKDSVAVDMANPQEEACNGGAAATDAVGKLEGEATPIIPTETWNVSSPTITKRSLSPLLTIQATPVVTPAAESPNGVALKVDLASAFFPPPPLSHPYSSPLASLVPPATLLVPYPVVIPLPMPLPIPVPIPVPVSMCKNSKIDVDCPKPACTSSKSTQTSPSDISPHLTFTSKEMLVVQQPLRSCSSPVVTDGEVLDLSIRTPQPSMHVDVSQGIQPFQQDSVLDLSIPSTRKTCIKTCSMYGPMALERERVCHMGDDVSSGALALGVLRPADCTPKLDTKLLSGLASLEFSRQHKWVVDSGHASAVAGAVHDSALTGSGNIEIVSTSQTAKVIVSVKDAMPAIFCSKLKGLSGVSTKNFSIKRDASQGGFATLPRVPGDQRGESSDPLKKMSKNRGIKLKKVSSQEIHILPIKKQRLTAFLPRK
ncbi:hypothetical protein cypCar_00016773 [Cyprinus carpio]|nr:hypothetical protein cypCar_00016773 [Cyprinus carpio]